MSFSRPLIVDFAQDIAILAVVILSYTLATGRMRRSDRLENKLVLGFIFGIGTVLVMLTPIQLADGVFFDMRSVMLGLAAPFGGIPAAIVATVIASVYRLWLGGAGAVAGVSGIALAAAAGILLIVYHRWFKRALRIDDFLVLSALLLVQLLVSSCLLPSWTLTYAVVEATFVPFGITTVVGTILLGGLLLHERRRHDLEMALAESEHRFQAIAENMPAILHQRRMTPAGAISYPYFNDRVKDIIGIAPEEAMRNPNVLLNTIHPDDRAAFEASLEASRANLTPWYHDFRIITTSGELKWLRGSNTPRRLPNGDVLWDGIVAEITQLKKAEEALRESESRFRLLAENATDVISRASSDSTRIYISPSSRQVLGYEPEELIGMKIQGIIHPDDVPTMNEAQKRLSAATPQIEITVRSRKKDGTYIWLEIRRQAVFDAQTGEMVGSVGVLRDISKRVALQQELARAKEQAEQASRAKSTFLASMSHELRTPLNSIMGFSEIIQNESLGTIANKQYLEYAGIIHTSGEHLLGLINDILDFSKVEAGKFVLHEEPVDVKSTIRACMRMMESRAAAGNVTLEARIANGLPELQCDPIRIKQITLNLLTNAIKFTESGGRVAIEAGLDADGNMEIAVSDTGVGIADEDQARVLEPFVQVDNESSRSGEGTGLGLPLTKRLVELHGGTLALRSKLREGTTVTARFPRAKTIAPVTA